MVRQFTALDPVGQFIIVVGAVLALLVLYDHLRRRGAPLEAALMFGAVAAGTFFLNQIHVAWMFALGAVLFLAKPYLLVRLLQNFRPVPVLGRRLIVAGMVASWLLAIAISPPSSPPSLPVQAAVLALIGYLVAVEAYAAVAFVRGALESPGVNRRRLTLATAGSAFLGASAVLDGIRISLEGASVLSPTWQLILWPSVGLASLSYFLAFAPPSWLRQAWQMIELRRFLRQGAGMSAGVRADEAVNRLMAAAVRATGAPTALVALWDEARQALVVPARDAASPELEFPPDGSDIGRAWREKKAVSVQNLSELGTGGASLAGPDVGALFAIPIATNERTWGLLLVLLRRASLFPADDMVVLSLLADQSAIALANAEQIAQLRALAATLRETNVDLERASQAKSEFLASMSHELRTPMNAILGFTDALLAGVDGPLTDTQKESLGWVQRGGRDLLALINEVLDLSKIEAGKVVLKAELFAPAELIEGIVGQHRRLAEEKGLRFEWMDDGAPAQVNLDRQRTQQIVVNLVGNALKFTPQGEVKLVASSTSDGGLKVAVQDTGPGIAAEHQELLFQEFRQVGAAAGNVGGSGLGLAISRRLARMMGGDIKLRSRPGRGSTFTITLPADCTVPVAPRVKRRERGRRLLLAVDDDRSLQPLLQKMLVGTNYQVVGAHDAARALQIAREQHPDVITLDIVMPERDGWQILQDLRHDPATQTIPVVILSVVEPTQALDDIGAAAYLTKPLNKEAVLAALEGALAAPAAAGSGSR